MSVADIYSVRKNEREMLIMIEFRKDATREEVKEFFCLVRECLPKKFTMSAQVTSYIMKNKLGFKYKHIAGELTLSKGADTWIYKGGISPEYYGKLCRALGLGNKKSKARVEEFQSFAQLAIF